MNKEKIIAYVGGCILGNIASAISNALYPSTLVSALVGSIVLVYVYDHFMTVIWPAKKKEKEQK